MSQSEYIAKLKRYLREISIGYREPKEPLTHMLEMIVLIREGLGEFGRVEQTHFVGESLVSEVEFADGKTYLLTLKEK